MVCGRGPSIGAKAKEVSPFHQSGAKDLLQNAQEGAVDVLYGDEANALRAATALAAGGIALGGAAGGAAGAAGAGAGAGGAASGAAGGAGAVGAGAAGAAAGGSLFNSIIQGVGGALGVESLGDALGVYGDYRQGEMTQDAIRDSARLQHEAAMAGIDEQRSAREQLRTDLQPYSDFGQQSLSPLSGAVQGGDFGRSAMIGGEGNPLLQQAVSERQAYDPSQAMSPEILQNPLLRAMQDDVSRRLMANQAARGKLGSGGTAEALQQRLVPQAINFGLQMDQLNRQGISDRQNLGLSLEDLRQRDVNNLFQQAQIGGNAAAQQGQAGLSVASNIGNLQQQGAGAQSFGALGGAAARGQRIGQAQNLLGYQNYTPTLG